MSLSRNQTIHKTSRNILLVTAISRDQSDRHQQRMRHRRAEDGDRSRLSQVFPEHLYLSPPRNRRIGFERKLRSVEVAVPFSDRGSLWGRWDLHFHTPTSFDNQTVYDMLVACLREARQRRQVIIVTHNPNLAVACDADQIVHSHIDKQHKNKVTYTSGSIENPKTNALCITVLEGTRPAFVQRERNTTRARSRLK
jgi:hypothetical protein